MVSRAAPTARRAPQGFTLVELVTVMGILVILVALVVPAVQGLRAKAAREGTQQLIAALQVGLEKYYDDWGKFPWINSPTNTALLGEVAGAAPATGWREIPSYCPIRTDYTQYEHRAEAMLFAVLNMRERNGPYTDAGVGASREMVLAGATAKYRVYVDGWGRAIRYFQPVGTAKFPLLMSEGALADFPDDRWPNGTKADNLMNYDPRDYDANTLQPNDY